MDISSIVLNCHLACRREKVALLDAARAKVDILLLEIETNGIAIQIIGCNQGCSASNERVEHKFALVRK